ncbi:baseplate J/gp47 family protein [Vallitalea guaymasensis]|uniref:baseplate J/gp47 family protein n=1 Tax=Vallitalea guaymasensis TaxID=1185412 RepID=UPI0023543E75|nr:baseplate J/gp47 family protein [Vallitalea guaymasensis]
MFEHMTYESIVEDAMSKIPDTVDKRQGSIIYDAIAPACAELAQLYIDLDTALKMSFVTSSSGEFLDRKCADFGIYRRNATKAIRKGAFTGVTPKVGSRFGLGDLTYVVKDDSGGMENVTLECEQEGLKGNSDTGTLIPIEEIEGLMSAVLQDVIVPGEDMETDESLLDRQQEKVKKSATSGNIYHYQKWAKDIKGVGAAKVIPRWNGDYTVKVIVVDTLMQPASQALVDEIQEYIDPSKEGRGKGTAPIGAKCTVEAAVSQTVDLTATVIDADKDDVKNIFTKELSRYFTDLISDNWQDKDNYSISYAKVGAILLDAISQAGGSDYSNLTINGGTSNVVLTDRVPVIGTVTLNE